MRLQVGREPLLIEPHLFREVEGIGFQDFHQAFSFALDWMEDNGMRCMHNGYDVHASGEITAGRLESADYLCSDCRGEEHNSGSVAVTAQPACAKQSTAASTRDVSG